MVILLLTTVAAAAPLVEPADYDLATARPRAIDGAQSCPRTLSAGDEIVVCGRTGTPPPYRLRPIDGPIFAEQPLEARLRLPGGSSLQAHATPGLDGTARAMITWSLNF